MNMTSSNMMNSFRNRDLTTRQNTQATQRQPMFTQQPAQMESQNSVGFSLPAPTSVTPTTLESDLYFAGLLSRYVGERVRVQFLIGTSGPLIDITGRLLQVGANYIIIQPTETDDQMIADLFSIKFVTIYR
jgi:hypothetical protein